MYWGRAHVKQLKFRHHEHPTSSQNTGAALDEQLIVGYAAGKVPDVNDV